MKRQPLKGLILYLFFSAKGHLMMTFVLVLFFAIFFLVTGATPMFGFVSINFIATFSVLGSASEDKANRWEKFQLSMPIRRKDVITAKYTFYLMMTIIALVMTILIVMIAHLFDSLNIVEYGSFALGGIEPVMEFIHTFASPTQITMNVTLISLGTALLTCALYYPLAYTIFKGKEELLVIIVFLGNFAVVGFLMWLGSRLDLSFNQIAIFNVIAPLILLGLSYLFTVKMYEKLDV